MAYTIAVAGKGGTGKTTLCGLLISALCREGKGPVLAVDADSNSNLNEVMGVAVEKTLGSVREEIKGGDGIPASSSRGDYLDAQFDRALIEDDDFDMLVMGRTQGTGCYCFVNSLLKTRIARFSGNYKYVVADNEAGMEHLSRGVLPGADMILIVSDCSRRGIQAAARIRDLVGELDMRPSAVRLIINRAPDGAPDAGVLAEAAAHGLDVAGVVPHDRLVYEFDCEGRPTAQLPEESPARQAFERIMRGALAL
ncbi:MAG: AAA family ATPase [Clostridiales bacterium]|jgi:CO dehydrogenase maturation factor|nr:AAA family ATPase [Clostridiales bacterium]